MKADEATLWEGTARNAAQDFDPLELVYQKEVPYFEKYDEFVPEELIRKGFAYDILGVAEMRAYFLEAAQRRISEKRICLTENS